MAKTKSEKSATFYADHCISVGRKKSAKRTKTFFVIFALVVIVAAVIFFVARRSTGKRTKFGRYCYLLVVGNFGFASDAQEVADNVEKAGGAGFVWVDESFEVVAFAYPTQKAAENVQKNLEETSWDAKIKKVRLKKPAVSKMTGNQKAAINYIWDLMGKLYDISIGFDSKRISNAAAHTELLKISKELNKLSVGLGGNEIDVALSSRLNLIKTEIDDFLKKSYAQNLYSSGMKLIFVKTIYACSGLYAEVD